MYITKLELLLLLDGIQSKVSKKDGKEAVT